MPTGGQRAEPGLRGLDAWLAAAALVLMLVLPVAEIAVRPLWGRGIENAPVLVQHLGLVLAMFGAVMAARSGELTSLGSSLSTLGSDRQRRAIRAWVDAASAAVCGMLVLASWRFVDSERAAAQTLAYGWPIWTVQAVMPLGFAWLAGVLGLRGARGLLGDGTRALALAPLAPLAGLAVAAGIDGRSWPIGIALAGLALLLLAGAPVFVVLGGLALALFAGEGLPLASAALSHYQITVNASLPALPLFTLAGLVFARTGAAQRLSALFVALFGTGARGTTVAAAMLCSVFTAFTGGSGVTILALGGLLLPLLSRAGCPEDRGIALVTSASALGVLLAPSVPLIMVAVIARVPIVDMFLAGLLPAGVMVASLLVVGGFLRPVPAVGGQAPPPESPRPRAQAAWAAKWELLAPVVALAPLALGLATPTEVAALTAAYAVVTQALVHRELGPRLLASCLGECARIIGGVMLILGMALALTNFLVDAGIPDRAVEWAQAVFPNRLVFLFALCLFLAAAAALMEIFAAIVVLVPLLLPVAISYGIEPMHFGIIFLAAMEFGFLCPPAGMNLYFASAMFGRPVWAVARPVLPALLAILVGTLLIALFPPLTNALPALFSR
jgi:tripartite ATP-independent transporter DctM subunit